MLDREDKLAQKIALPSLKLPADTVFRLAQGIQIQLRSLMYISLGAGKGITAFSCDRLLSLLHRFDRLLVYSSLVPGAASSSKRLVHLLEFSALLGYRRGVVPLHLGSPRAFLNQKRGASLQ